MDPFWYLCITFVFIILSCLFLACWESSDLLPLLSVMLLCVFVTFPYGVLGTVWYLSALIPILCFSSLLIVKSNNATFYAIHVRLGKSFLFVILI